MPRKWTRMHTRSIRVVAVMAVAIVTALAGADRASAGGVEIISACQTLSDFNTVYKLATDLGSCGDCLFVTNSKITIDCRGTPSPRRAGWQVCGHHRPGGALDLITVKNGSISGYETGVELTESTRVSVLGVKTTNNSFDGIWVGAHGLVKFTETSGNGYWHRGRRAYGQVQQCNAHDKRSVGIARHRRQLPDHDEHCQLQRRRRHRDARGGNKCTVSYNTANDNGIVGIDAGDSGGTGHLITQNVALHNGATIDFAIDCPSNVTNNTSTAAFPTSYLLNGTGCHLVNNN